MKATTWYEELGYAHNPFTIKPGFFDDEVFGYDKTIDTVQKRLEKGNIVFLQGEYGLGKTTTLKYFINEFKDRQRVIYISRNRSDRAMNYKNLLKDAAQGVRKLFGKKATNVLLIVDETEKINEKDCKQIMGFYNSGHFSAVLFVDKSFKDARLTADLKKKIGKNVFSLKGLQPKEAIALARSRLDGNKKIITNDLLEKIYKKSNKNTRQFLLNLEEVFKHAFENGKKKITKKDVDVLE